jgi:hypothetical protein
MRTIGRPLKGSSATSRDYAITYDDKYYDKERGVPFPQAYCYSDQAGEVDSQKSTTGFVVLLGGGPILVHASTGKHVNIID